MGAEDVPLEEAAERARELYECMFALRRQARCLSFISESARPATTPIDFAFEIQRELSSCDELDLNDLRIGEVTAIPASSDDEVHVDVVVEHAGDPIGANWWSTRW